MESQGGILAMVQIFIQETVITIIISETTLSFINKSFISNLKISMLPFILFIILYLSIFYKLKFTNTKTNN